MRRRDRLRAMRSPNPYASGKLDRAAHLRGDETRLDGWLHSRASRIVPVWRARNLVHAADSPAAIFLSGDEASPLVDAARFTAFLGLVDGVPHFAIDISEVEEPANALPRPGLFEDLRNVGTVLDSDEGNLLAYARGLFSWHGRHRFCGACGAPTESAQAGHVRRCSDPACATQHFPRLDPAVIVLVHDDSGHCLLGRHRRLPSGIFTTLAGFVEPGESLEDAVVREVREESGIDVDDVHYHSSQPWPFPSSLMLGFHAHAATTDIAAEDDELDEVRWFTRDEVRASPEDEKFRLPRADSIARRLILDWLEET